MIRVSTEEEQRRFLEACASNPADGGIGTLSEKTLHAALKRYYEPDEACREQSVGTFVADICKGDRIIEIQTRNLYSLRQKLDAYLAAGYRVTVVHPVAATRRSCRIDKDGTVSEPRLVTKKGDFTSALRELYGLRAYLQKIDLRLLLLDVTDYRKIGQRDRVDRVPNALLGQIYLCDVSDYASLLPALPATFTSKTLNDLLHVPSRQRNFTVGVFLAAGVIEPCGREGKTFYYQLKREEDPHGSKTGISPPAV